MFFGYFWGVLVQLQLSWPHGGVEINWLKLHDTLKINPRIRNYQKHKNSGQALHEDGKKNLKSEEVWLNQEERNKKKFDLAVFFIFMIEDNLGKIYL